MTIKLSHIKKTFGDTLVVNGVNVEVKTGELLVLLGSSGSGKSTLLKIIAGLETADEGTVELEGRDVTDVAPQHRGIGFVFQHYAIFKHLTVANNVAFALKIRGVSRAEREQRVSELLDLVGLTGLGSRYPRQLSGGQLQRVALARALAHQPALLLLDEPFGALDVRLRSRLRRSLREIQRQLNVTSILVTHDQEEAFELGDRIGVLDRGRLVEVATPQDLYHRPHHESAALFVGGGNVLVGRHQGQHLRLGNALLPMPAGAMPHAPGGAVRVLIRPEWLTHRDAPASDQIPEDYLGRGRVADTIFAGAQERIRFEVDNVQGVRPPLSALAYGQRFTVMDTLQASSHTETSPLARGQERWLQIKHYHVLEPTSFRILAMLKDYRADSPALEIASALAASSHGMLCLFSVAPEGKAPKFRDALSQLQKDLVSRSIRTDVHVAQGDLERAAVLEAQESYYDIVAMNISEQRPISSAPSTMVASRLLTAARIPTLFARSNKGIPKRILICTGGGEPGKKAIHFGSRVARQCGASVEVLHVLASNNSAEIRRVERHLELADSMVRVLSLESSVRMLQGPPVATIMEESRKGDFDLVVLGGAINEQSQPLARGSIPDRLASELQCSVLIVPMPET